MIIPHQKKTTLTEQQTHSSKESLSIELPFASRGSEITGMVLNFKYPVNN